MPNAVLTGNICSVLAMITDALSTSRKTGRSMLVFQTFSQLFYIVGSVVLKGYSAAVQNAVSAVRNLLAIGKKQPKWLEWVLIGAAVVLGIVFNNRGLVGYLPVIANLEYSLAVFRFKDNDRALKFCFLIMVGMFIVFNFAIQNYVGSLANAVVFVTTAAFLIKSRKAK